MAKKGGFLDPPWEGPKSSFSQDSGVKTEPSVQQFIHELHCDDRKIYVEMLKNAFPPVSPREKFLPGRIYRLTREHFLTFFPTFYKKVRTFLVKTRHGRAKSGVGLFRVPVQLAFCGFFATL